MQVLHFTNKMVTEKEKRYLLQLARNAIVNYPDSTINFNNVLGVPGILKERHGIFVSVYINAQLRGCIGNLLPSISLYKSVIKTAIDAAYHDYRFPPLTKEELNSLRIEISLLTDPVLLDYIDANHLLKKLGMEEGVIIKKGPRLATFLPQVWEKISDKEEFLTNLCFKANLNTDAWMDSNVEIYTYKVERFMDSGP